MQIFGEYSFITGLERKETAVSKIFCKVYLIKRESFLNLIKKNSNSYESFCNLRDNILVNVMEPSKKLGLLELLKGKKPKHDTDSKDANMLKCYICLENGHPLRTCPLVQMLTNRRTVISRYQLQLRE